MVRGPHGTNPEIRLKTRLTFPLLDGADTPVS